MTSEWRARHPGLSGDGLGLAWETPETVLLCAGCEHQQRRGEIRNRTVSQITADIL